MSEITVIDYGLSNLCSVQNALRYLGASVTLACDAAAVQKARRLLLPGVGAFADGMQGLHSRGLTEAIQQQAANGVPLLGICLGMQMLLEESDEFGQHKGLGLVPGRVERLPAKDAQGNRQRVPNIGWAALQTGTAQPGARQALQHAGMQPGTQLYFVHSYEAKPHHAADVLATVQYGGREVCAAVHHENLLGCQFHPEKSGAAGLAVLQAFLSW